MFHHRSIKDWHQGTMSSRLLLALLFNLPDHSAFKTYARPPFGRGGRWSVGQHIAAYTGNKLAKLQADYINVHRDEEAHPEPYEPEYLEDPVDLIEATQPDQAADAAVDEPDEPGGMGSLWHLQDDPEIFE